VQVEVAEALVERAQVVLGGPVEELDATDVGAVGRLVGQLLDEPRDAFLERVGELAPVRAEQLDAVVRVRVVRRGDDGREVEAQPADDDRPCGNARRPPCRPSSPSPRSSATGWCSREFRRYRNIFLPCARFSRPL
jgi:hypothetical protein